MNVTLIPSKSLQGALTLEAHKAIIAEEATQAIGTPNITEQIVTIITEVG